MWMDAENNTACCDHVSWLRVTWSNSERKGTWTLYDGAFSCLLSLHLNSHLCPTSCSTGTVPPDLTPVTAAHLLRFLFPQGSGKKVPPAAQLLRVKQPASHSAVKREKRFSTSSFPLSANRELQKLPALAGMFSLTKRCLGVLSRVLHFWFLSFKIEFKLWGPNTVNGLKIKVQSHIKNS